MMLTPDALVQKWQARFADNDEFLIAAADLREYVQDVAETFGQVPATVLAYMAGHAYQVNDLVRHQAAGQPEAFYYALAAGPLPAPTGQDDDASWQVVPGPVAAATLSQALSLRQARGLVFSEAAGLGVQAGRQYAINLGLDRTYYVQGLAGTFDVEGTLVDDQGTRTKGSLDLATGTFTPRAAGGSGGGSGGGVTPAELAVVATSVPLRPAHGTDYTLTAADVGALVPVGSAYPLVVTVPQGLGLPAPSGSETGAARLCTILPTGTGALSLHFEAGVTVQYPAGEKGGGSSRPFEA